MSLIIVANVQHGPLRPRLAIDGHAIHGTASNAPSPVASVYRHIKLQYNRCSKNA